MTESDGNKIIVEPATVTPRDISTARDPDVRASLVAMRRAAQLARKTAIQTDTELIVVQDGQIVRVSAKALREEADTQQDATR